MRVGILDAEDRRDDCRLQLEEFSTEARRKFSMLPHVLISLPKEVIISVHKTTDSVAVCTLIAFLRFMPTVLGLPGDLTGDSSCLSPLDWKAGGRAIVPASIGSIETPLLCGVCAKRLLLVLQASIRDLVSLLNLIDHALKRYQGLSRV